MIELIILAALAFTLGITVSRQWSLIRKYQTLTETQFDMIKVLFSQLEDQRP